MEPLRWKAKQSAFWLALIRVFLGVTWFVSGLEKLAGGEFAASLATTLGRFASKNPYGWYADFLKESVIPNSDLFASLVAWGEVVVGLALIFGIVTVLAAAVGITLNLNFYLAAMWASPAVHTLNLMMIFLQAIVAVAYASKSFSLDLVISQRVPRLGRFLRAAYNERVNA